MMAGHSLPVFAFSAAICLQFLSVLPDMCGLRNCMEMCLSLTQSLPGSLVPFTHAPSHSYFINTSLNLPVANLSAREEGKSQCQGPAWISTAVFLSFCSQRGWLHWGGVGQKPGRKHIQSPVPKWQRESLSCLSFLLLGIILPVVVPPCLQAREGRGHCCLLFWFEDS